MIYVEKARVIEREQFDDISLVSSVKTINFGSPSWRGFELSGVDCRFLWKRLVSLLEHFNHFFLVTLHVSCQMFFPGGKNWKKSSDYPWDRLQEKGDCSSRNW